MVFSLFSFRTYLEKKIIQIQRNPIQFSENFENSREEKKKNYTKITVKGCRDEINVTILNEEKIFF